MPRPAIVLGFFVLTAPCFAAEPPFHQTIDRELAAGWKAAGVTPVPPASDGTFLRRVYLDLLGTVPTYAETTAFLDDRDPAKRTKLIERLLADPRFAPAQAMVWDQVLFGRNPANGDAVRKREAFKQWLTKQFVDQVPYHVWVKTLFQAETPGTELFHVQFRNQPEEATVATTRIFLGVQLQCARCHDHPYDQWTQKDFYGMTGFFVRLVVQESGNGDKRKYVIGEKASGEVLFSGSVKDQAPGKKGEPVRPRFLGGTDLDEPMTAKPMKEPTPKSGELLPKPPFSRKERFAAWLASPENPYLARAAVNRVWAQFMGRGIVHPIDDFHADNTPSHPELLKQMTEQFRAHNFDLKWLIREIVSSQAYQLSDEGPGQEALPKRFDRARIRPLTAEELVASMRLVTGYDVGLKPGEKLPSSGEEYFLRYFGEPTNGLGEFQGSLQEHLFLNNGEHVRRMLSRKKGNLTDILLSSTDHWPKRVDRLYLTVLNRPPTESERATFVTYLSAKSAKPEALVEDAIWALLNSSEFRFNH